MNSSDKNNKLTYDELVDKVADLEAKLAAKTQQLEITEKNLESTQFELEMTKLELDKLKKLVFGQKRERFIPSLKPEQLDLELGAIAIAEPVITTEEVSYTRKRAEKSPKHTPHGRQQLPDHLPRKIFTIEPEEDVTGFTKIGDEVTEELEYEPPKYYVNQYIRPKYVRPVAPEEDSLIENPASPIVIAALPSRPIEKGIPGPALLANILISKFVDHQPLYRQIQQIKRYTDWEVASSTINGWIKSTCKLLEPLHNKTREIILLSNYLQVDETTLPVLDRRKKGKCHLGYHWVYHAPLQRLVLFYYYPGRGSESPNAMLENFKGFLQTDGYKGYNQVQARSDIIAVGCMGHARRKFIEARPTDVARAEWMLTHLQSLYKIEAVARENGLSFEQRRTLRQEYAVPILNEMKTWLTENLPQILPKSLMGKAFGYMLNRWQALMRYTEDGRLEIDNNWVENLIRPIALGRKNYLFAGSHEGARWAATIYSLVANARLHEINPENYLRDVLSRIADHPYHKLDELLPPKWKPLAS